MSSHARFHAFSEGFCFRAVIHSCQSRRKVERGKWVQSTTFSTLPCSKSQAWVITTTSSRKAMTRFLSASSGCLAPAKFSASTSHDSNGQSKMRSPCVKGVSAATKSYQGSFIVRFWSEPTQVDGGSPFRQLLRSDRQLFREKHCPLARWSKKSPPRSRGQLLVRFFIGRAQEISVSSLLFHELLEKGFQGLSALLGSFLQALLGFRVQIDRHAAHGTLHVRLSIQLLSISRSHDLVEAAATAH